MPQSPIPVATAPEVHKDRLSVEEYRALVERQLAAKKTGTGGSGPTGKTARKRPRSKTPKRSVKEEKDDTLVQRMLRLMAPRKLSSRLRIKPEEQLAIDFANALRALTLSGELKCVWTHPANEVAGQQTNLAQIRYAIAKAMGLIDGTSDYLFLWATGSGTLEAKVGKNDQQANQVDFERWCGANGVHYRTFTTVEEGLQALRDWGVLVENRI
jgi:hypothetical protein